MKITVLGGIGAIFVVACSSDAREGKTTEPAKLGADSGSTCGAGLPSSCPSTPPSFQTDVLPILNAKCNTCHVGGNGPWPLSDYGSVWDWRSTILTDLENCAMPPADAGAMLTAEEQGALVGWVLCGAPHN
jgi:hypothetical protein